jgi:hypothetical protein
MQQNPRPGPSHDEARHVTSLVTELAGIVRMVEWYIIRGNPEKENSKPKRRNIQTLAR